MAILIVIAVVLGVCLIATAALLAFAHGRPVSAYDRMCSAIDRSVDGATEPPAPRPRTASTFIPAQRATAIKSARVHA